jgi:hypothetical protein
MTDYYSKYLKYKAKYLELKKQMKGRGFGRCTDKNVYTNQTTGLRYKNLFCDCRGFIQASVDDLKYEIQKGDVDEATINSGNVCKCGHHYNKHKKLEEERFDFSDDELQDDEL